MNIKIKYIALLAVFSIFGLAAYVQANCGTEGCGDGKACCDDEVCTCHKAAPDFTLTSTAGKEVQLSKLAGKIVVLEWTNYDCPFVKAHYKQGVETTKKLADKYAKQDVVWLTINSTHYATAEDNKQWAETHNLKQAVLIDNDGTVGKAYDAKTTPHIYIVDQKGNIAYQGAIDNAPMGKKPDKYVNYAEQVINELIDGKAPSVAKTKPYGCSVKYAKGK